jgi:hypothetical protein
MASEISGLEPLQGFLKHGNYVVRLQVPYLELKNRHEKFIERKIDPRGDGNTFEAMLPVKPPMGPQGMELNPQLEEHKFYFE